MVYNVPFMGKWHGKHTLVNCFCHPWGKDYKAAYKQHKKLRREVFQKSKSLLNQKGVSRLAYNQTIRCS